MQTQLTARCPKCGTLGIRFVNANGTSPTLSDFENVQRHKPVELPQVIKVMCANKNCDHEHR